MQTSARGLCFSTFRGSFWAFLGLGPGLGCLFGDFWGQKSGGVFSALNVVIFWPLFGHFGPFWAIFGQKVGCRSGVVVFSFFRFLTKFGYLRVGYHFLGLFGSLWDPKGPKMGGQSGVLKFHFWDFRPIFGAFWGFFGGLRFTRTFKKVCTAPPSGPKLAFLGGRKDSRPSAGGLWGLGP